MEESSFSVFHAQTHFALEVLSIDRGVLFRVRQASEPILFSLLESVSLGTHLDAYRVQIVSISTIPRDLIFNVCLAPIPFILDFVTNWNARRPLVNRRRPRIFIISVMTAFDRKCRRF